jgi:hypothetical protein
MWRHYQIHGLNESSFSTRKFPRAIRSREEAPFHVIGALEDMNDLRILGANDLLDPTRVPPDRFNVDFQSSQVEGAQNAESGASY